MIRRIAKKVLNKNATKRTGRAQQANRAQTRGTRRTAEPLSTTRARSNVRANPTAPRPSRPRRPAPSGKPVLPRSYVKAKKK